MSKRGHEHKTTRTSKMKRIRSENRERAANKSTPAYRRTEPPATEPPHEPWRDWRETHPPEIDAGKRGLVHSA